MNQILLRLLPLLLLVVYVGTVGAQQRDPVPDLKLGDAVVTGFSGTLAPDPAKLRARGKSAIDLTFINPDGPSVRVINVARPGYVWDGRLFAAPKTFDVLAKDVGQVFGIALDDQPVPNIYVAATSAFGLNIVSRGRDGLPERRKKGGPGAGWMKGQFGLDLQGGPGAIYKIDGRTGAPTLFANVTLDGVPNPGPGLGNLAYDSAHKQLFVSDLYTGMIHRFDLDGKELGSYDHGVTGLGAAKLATVPFNPKTRPNIASDRFDSEKPDTWGFAPATRRVWGLAMHNGRLYYSVMSGPQIWSVGIARDGSFAADPRWELDVPAQAGPLPVSDIAFSQKGAMILAQRGLVAGAYDYSAFTRPGEPQVFRVWLKGPNDPPSPGRWKLVPEEYAVGFAGTHRNTNGGVALGYGYGRDGILNANACEFSLWTTAQNIRNAPALKSRLDPGGPLVVHGLAGMPASPVRSFNEPPWTSYAVDYDEAFRDPRATGHLGSVRIYSKPCASPAVYSGPGYPANPPYIVVVNPPPDCRPNCPPPPPYDIGIQKIGEVNLNNPHGDYNFTIGVTNLAAPLTGPQTITVTDVVPAGMTFTNVTSVNWTCSPIPGPPIPAGGTLTCTYTGMFPVATNQLLGTISIVGTGGAGPYENCANLGQIDGNSSNDKACVTVKKPGLDVKLEKKLKDRAGVHGFYEINVSNIGMAFTNGAFTVTDSVPNGMTVMATSGPWTCVTLPVVGPGTMTCTLPVASISSNLALPPIGFTTLLTGSGPWENCAVVAVVTLSGTDNNPSNDKGCVTVTNDPVGEIIVEKKVVSNGPLLMPNLTYPVTVTCGTWTKTFNLVPNTPQSEGNVPRNVDCNVVETLPPPPASACPTPLTPVWQTPVIVPSIPFQLTANTTTVTVTNTLDCVQGGDGSLVVTKNVTNNTSGTVTNSSFAVAVSCQSGTSPAVVTPLTLVNGVPQTVSNIALGSNCTVTETEVLQLPAPGTCTGHSAPVWTTTYSPASPVPVNGSAVAVTIQNTLDCKSSINSDRGYVIVKKIVVNTTSANLSSMVFPVAVTCGNTGASVNLTIAIPSRTVHNILAGTVCTAVETLPPPPTTGCDQGKVPTWVNTPAYSPANATIVNGQGPTIEITNTLSCELQPLKHPPLTCTAPQIPNSSVTACICPDGKAVVPGRGCVSQTACKAPMIAGAVRGQCICPQGTVRRGNDCVKQTTCKAPMVQGAVPGQCVCPAGKVKRGARCVEQIVCHAPQKRNQAGTACVCPEGMTKKGKTCAEKERERPRVTPNDVLRVLPGLIGPGGFGGGGGGAGGGSGGGGGAGGGRYKP